MTAAQTIERLASAGITVTVEGGALCFVGDRTGYTAELRALVETHRDELLRGVGVLRGVPQPRLERKREALPPSDLKKDLGLKNTPQHPHTPQTTPADDPTPVAHTEIRALPIALTRHLPLPCTLLVRFQGAPDGPCGLAALTSSVAGRARALAASQACWSPGEYELAAYGWQEGRATSREVSAWSERKRRGGMALSAGDAVGGAWGLLERGALREGALRLTWGEWLDGMGAELVEVICEQVGAQAASAGAEAEEMTL